MRLETAEKIVELVWSRPRNTVEGIKILRYETHFDLEEARDYLNRGEIGGRALLVRLVADFVATSETQLDTATRMAAYWNQRVVELTAEVEEQQKANDVGEYPAPTADRGFIYDDEVVDRSTYSGAPDECNIHWPTKLVDGNCPTCQGVK